ncbi:hypothetical protein H6G89_26090 [Oscillatoria sp. FACHB-1407]|uniref:hypothetical protein n=1 Tax=Oscillatoria sp. FACHB-1407 TaxID=2692847 RepID=UPI0016839335|nr:hypothetical protein [Oscillatoria sp. FACHB-1407]MBD2464481.1 hypothetical protein [Oscillatoria sp. FACHB-1407]
MVSIILGPIALLTIPIGIFLLLKRVGTIRRVFAEGVPVEAILVQKRLSRGEWILRYRYSYGSDVYEVVNYVVGWSLGIQRGDRLEAVVNPKKPTQAFLTTLYLKKVSA